MKTVYLILMACAGLLATIFSLIGDKKIRPNTLPNNRTKFEKIQLFLRRAWVKVFTALITTVLIIWFNIERDKIIESDNVHEQAKNDSINRQKYREDIAVTSTKIAETMAKYKLKYDESQQEVVSLIKDSVNKKININRAIQPLLSFAMIHDSISPTSIILRIRMTVSGANAKNVRIKTSIVTSNGTNPKMEYKNDDSFDIASYLEIDRAYYSKYRLESVNFNNIVVLFSGTYSDQMDNKFTHRQYYSYLPNERRTSNIKVEYLDIVEKFFKNN